MASFDELAAQLRNARAAFDIASGRLPQPVELVHVQRFGAALFRAAVAEAQGWRGAHEDAHAVETEPASGSSMFLVLDGHGGDQASAFCAPALARALGAELERAGPGHLPSDAQLEHTFGDVEAQLRQHAAQAAPHPAMFHAGTTVVGCLLAATPGGSAYAAKLLNCGDSRGVVVAPPGGDDAAAEPVVRRPTHLQALASDDELLSWPLIARTVDHKPDHPTEKARIIAAGGIVTDGPVPRVDGLAVSRALGDFSHKSEGEMVGPMQKVSWKPDVFDIAGLEPGSIVVLGCDGLWDALVVEFVAGFVRDKLAQDPAIDLGDLCAELVSMCMESRDNITVMIVHMVDGTDIKAVQDEMKNFESIGIDLDGIDAHKRAVLGFLAEHGEVGDALRKQHVAFLARCGYPAVPAPCGRCGIWARQALRCPCGLAYCSAQCQQLHWNIHMHCCSVRRACCEPLLARQFARFDKNADGRVDRSEVRRVLSQLDPAFWNPRNLDALLASDEFVDEPQGLSFNSFARWACASGAREDPISSAFYGVLQAPAWRVARPSTFCDGGFAGVASPASSAWLLLFVDVDGVLSLEEQPSKEGTTPSSSSSSGALLDPTARCSASLDRRCLERLRLLLASLSEPERAAGALPSAAASRVRLVLTSTWRLDDNQLHFLRWALGEEGIEPTFLAGLTASLTRAGRAAEVLHFLDECAWNCHRVSAWIAVDDLEENLRGLEEHHCVLAPKGNGLDADVVARLRNSLVLQDTAWRASRGLPAPTYAKGTEMGEQRSRDRGLLSPKAKRAGPFQSRRTSSSSPATFSRTTAPTAKRTPSAKRAPAPAPKRGSSPPRRRF